MAGKWLGGNGENGVELERSPCMNFDGHFRAVPVVNWHHHGAWSGSTSRDAVEIILSSHWWATSSKQGWRISFQTTTECPRNYEHQPQFIQCNGLKSAPFHQMPAEPIPFMIVCNTSFGGSPRWVTPWYPMISSNGLKWLHSITL